MIGGISDVVKTGTSGSLTTLVDRSSSVRGIEPSHSMDQVVSTCFGQSANSYESGLEDFELSITFKYSASLFTIFTTMFKAREAPTVEWSPNGTGSSNPKVTGVMNISSISPPVAVGDHKEFTVELQSSDGNGATFGTH